MAPTASSVRLTLLTLAAALVLGASAARPASAAPVTINEPPAMPVSIAVLCSADAIEASGFTDGTPVDVELIRNGVVISKIVGATSVNGVLDVNAAGGACWTGVTPDIRPGDIVRFTQGNVANQVHVMPITVGSPISVGGGTVEIHGTASDLNAAPIPLANVDMRVVAASSFAVNGRKTLRAGAGNTDGTFAYDTVDNPTGTKWTVRFSNLSSGDVSLVMAAEMRARWLGTVPANANELTIYQNDTAVVPGPVPGTCTAPLEALDVTPPTAPSGLGSVQSGPSARTLTWLGSTDNVEVAGYEVSRDGAVIGRVGPLVHTFVDSDVPAGAHTYTVAAFDNASPLGAGATASDRIVAGFGQLWGNRSAPSNANRTDQPDIIAPSAPPALSVATGNGKAMPTWSPATDNVGVVSYGLFRNNVLIVTIPAPTTTYKDSGLVTGTYNYSVDAVDASGNHSARTSNVAANVIFIPDTTPPTTPGAVSAVVSPDIHGRDAIITWTAATDSMGVTGYSVFRNGAKIATLGPTVLSFTDAALATNTYVYRIDAFDAANNHSTLSAGKTAVIANDPPLTPHAIAAHPSRDWIAATGYPAAAGPYVFTVFRGAQQFSSAAINADASGLVQVNHAGGGCWAGATPDLRAGDVIRITNAAGIAEQTTVASVRAQFAAGTAAGTVTVHGTAQDATGHPIPIGQLEHRLVLASGTFAKSGSATLRAGAAAGLDGSLSYDAPGSIHWTATYSGLSADDVARATGGVGTAGATFAPVESRALWLGRTPVAATEQSMAETGLGVMGGPAATVCATPAESPLPAGAYAPAALNYGDVGAIPPSTSLAKTVEFMNTGTAPLTVYGFYIAGQNAGDFAISSSAGPTVIAPGASFGVDVTFSPKALGARHAIVAMSCDAANTTALGVVLDGNGATDVTAPTVPAGVSATVSPDIHGRDADVSWNAASDSVGVTGYTLRRDGAVIATLGPSTLSYHDASLAPAPHVYTVDAFDLQNNHSAVSAAAKVVIASDPPAASHTLEALPALDAISASGYAAASGPYVVTLYRGNQVFVSAPVNADADGVVQVNRDGGGCWSGTTPNLRAGDVIRISDAAGFADQTTVMDVTAGLPIAADSATIVVHGTARGANGLPLPLDQIEHWLVARAGAFERNGAATLRARAAGGEGTIAYDAAGSIHWTATYAGLSWQDVSRATGGLDSTGSIAAIADSRGIWLGRSPAAGNERTIAEAGAGVLGGPAGSLCAAPAEAPAAAAASTPGAVAFGMQSMSAPVEGDPVAVFFSNTGSAPMAIGDVQVAGLDPGDFSIVSNDAPAVLAPGAYFTVRVAFAPKALGRRQAALALTSDAANTAVMAVPLTGVGSSGIALAVPGRPARSFLVHSSITLGANPLVGTLPVRIDWDASPAASIVRYDVQESVNGGAWVDAAVQPDAATGIELSLPLDPGMASTTYQFRVRAASANAVSAWVTGERFSLEAVDDTRADRVVFTGAWHNGPLDGAYGGTARTTFEKLDVRLLPTKPFAVTGSIAWITAMGPDRGMVTVWVDNKDSVNVDLYSPTFQAAAVGYVATGLQAGRSHSLRVRSMVQNNKLAIAARVDADGFVILSDVPRSAPTGGRSGDAMLSGLPETPKAFAFAPIAPNPVSIKATLAFALPHDGPVHLDVLDVQGRLVSRLADGVMTSGEHRLTWDGTSSAGRAVGSGVYFAVLRYGEQSLTRRLIWMP